MKIVHVECKPDELLVSKLGVQKKQITHHQGKTRVFHALGRGKHNWQCLMKTLAVLKPVMKKR